MPAETIPPHPPPVAPPPGPADVGIVAALPIEVGRLIAMFADSRKYASQRHTIIEGLLGGKLTALIVGGPGRQAARRAAELILAGHRPRWLVSAGFGGALDPEAKRDDVLLATEVVDQHGLRIQIDVRAEDARIRTGRLVTVDRIVRTAAEKAELRLQSGADVVDMETSEVAALCAERGLRFLSVRVISDEAGHDLPREVAAILGRSGGYQVGAAIGAIWRRPGSLVDLLTLREHALSAATRLAEVLPTILSRLD